MAKDGSFHTSKKQMVEWIRYVGQFILDNSEDIVGNYHGTTGIKITADVQMNELPVVNVSRDYQVADWNNRRKSLMLNRLQAKEESGECGTCVHKDESWYSVACDNCCQGESNYEPREDNPRDED